MGRVRTVHRCRDCGATTPRWAGRCPGCDEWGTLVEEVAAARAPSGGLRPVGAVSPGYLTAGGAAPVALGDIDGGAGAPTPTGVDELDRVLGGGLVPGGVTLVGGEPGVGKSTLLLQAAASMAGRGQRCLLVSAEESAQQVRRRAERLGAVIPGVWLVAETSLPGIRAAVAEVRPDVIVVDSIQTVWDPEVEGAPGGVTQVRGCAQNLVALAKAEGIAVVLVGHVTKEGALAGPRVLEHVVDTVLTFEGDRHHALRLLRSTKHRFGATGELGLFEMSETGLRGVPDASGLFLGDRRLGAPGSAVFPAMEGQRPLLVELQALVVESKLPAPRRSVSGLDANRLSLLLAVLYQRAGVGVLSADVYVSVVGGVRIAEPGADLALCMALTSAGLGRPVPDDLVVLGEVGLAGELRQVGHTAQRLAEAARLGFTRALVPASVPEGAPLVTLRAATLAEAVDQVFATSVAGRTPATARRPIVGVSASSAREPEGHA